MDSLQFQRNTTLSFGTLLKANNKKSEFELRKLCRNANPMRADSAFERRYDSLKSVQ